MAMGGWLRKSKNRAAVSGLVIKKLSVYLENSLFRCVWLGSGLFVDIVSENRLVVKNAARDLQRLIHVSGFRGKIDITKNVIFNYRNDSKDWERFFPEKKGGFEGKIGGFLEKGYGGEKKPKLLKMTNGKEK